MDKNIFVSYDQMAGFRTVAVLLFFSGLVLMVHSVQSQKVSVLQAELNRTRQKLKKFESIYEGKDPLSLYDLQLAPLNNTKTTTKNVTASDVFKETYKGESPWFERNVTQAPMDKNISNRK
jgi:hypothetical protein